MGIALGLLGGLFLGGASYLSPARVAKMVDHEIRARVGEVRQLRVRVQGPRGVPVMKGRVHTVDVDIEGFNGDTANVPEVYVAEKPAKRIGTIRSIHVEARDFIYDRARIARASITLTGLKYDQDLARKKQLRLVEMEAGTMEIHVAEDELRARALERLSAIEQPELHFVGDRLMVTGKQRVGKFSVPFSLSGRVVVSNQREVSLAETDLRVVKLPVPYRIEQLVLTALNPVYVFKEANKLPFEVEVQHVDIGEKELVAHCKVMLSRKEADARMARMSETTSWAIHSN